MIQAWIFVLQNKHVVFDVVLCLEKKEDWTNTYGALVRLSGPSSLLQGFHCHKSAPVMLEADLMSTFYKATLCKAY